MRCVICKQGKTFHSQTTVTLERGFATLVVKEVPADICENCGEAYVQQKITSKLLKIAEEAIKSGIQVDVRKYRAA